MRKGLEGVVHLGGAGAVVIGQWKCEGGKRRMRKTPPRFRRDGLKMKGCTRDLGLKYLSPHISL